ncbi:hypothetical protein RUND412_011162 [Rhizina undulata]
MVQRPRTVDRGSVPIQSVENLWTDLTVPVRCASRDRNEVSLRTRSRTLRVLDRSGRLRSQPAAGSKNIWDRVRKEGLDRGSALLTWNGLGPLDLEKHN